ncbi:MAG: hypothetical protein J0I09_10420 [Sphingobacteriia bacterium]|nr:hypothetical protein [Sphingobacteriia bacterium]
MTYVSINMIKTTSSNRSLIKDYLSNLSEDELIEQVIIPLLNLSGYILYRLVTHGPGEHGKDIIFYRHVPLLYDHEFVIVQAKAEKVNTHNVEQFAQQCLRAFKVPFNSISGDEKKKANYVLFINSMEHTNDATAEFPSLIENNNNIKILSQQNLIEIIIFQNFIPDTLIGKLDEVTFIAHEFEERIRRIIVGGNDKEIHGLMETELRIETRTLSNDLQGYIINYIFLLWSNDTSWSGTVIPMKWLDYYFNYIQANQFSKLILVINEYTSSHPSRAAIDYTKSIVSKIEPNQITLFEKEFITLIVRLCYENSLKNFPLLEPLFFKYIASPYLSTSYSEIVEKIKNDFYLRNQIGLTGSGEPSMAILKNDLKSNRVYLREFIYPEEED